MWTLAKLYAPRLALANLTRNRRMIFPYFIAAALMSAMYFIITNLLLAKSIQNMSHGATTQSMLMIGQYLMTLFIVGYMFYINSFLMKRRKKEFGLYGVLGLEKRHVARIILLESLYLNLAALALGLAIGCAFGRLCFLALMRVIRVAAGSVYRLEPDALTATCGVFCVVFVLTTAYNLLQVYRANPIELLHGGQKGERRARFTPLMAVLGAVLLGAAYACALLAASPINAMLLFWPAVLLVIVATYLLFTAGSAFALNLLSRCRSFYYRPGPFIAVSSLKYRMKQNAAGLSNICILSTMVLVTMTACCGLYFGQEDIARERNPFDIASHAARDSDGSDVYDAYAGLLEEARAASKSYGVQIEDALLYRSASGGLCVIAQDGAVRLGVDPTGLESYSVTDLVLLPPSAYRTLTGEALDLAADEIGILYDRTLSFDRDALGGYTPVGLGWPELAISRKERSFAALQRDLGAGTDVLYVVAPTDEAMGALTELLKIPDRRPNRASLCLNLTGPEDACLAFAGHLRALHGERMKVLSPGEGITYSFDDIYNERLDGYALFGGLIFLGVFFALLFLVNTVLIIYFKQVSEGYEDRDRFIILQKVGMGDREVKRTINQQILLVFFLPLLVALLHTVFAAPMLAHAMEAFSLHNAGLTFLCALIASLCFSAVYALVFRLTARTYYGLVKR